MVDLNLSARAVEASVELDGVDLRRDIELLFFAYREFTAGPDDVLAAYGYGRAHHRVLHFVGRSPGITVQQLLQILRITKQSLARVLKTLVGDGYVAQVKGERDGRMRHLHLTEAGKALEADCSARQRERVLEAFAEAGPQAVDGYRQVLRALVRPEDRDSVFGLVDDV